MNIYLKGSALAALVILTSCSDGDNSTGKAQTTFEEATNKLIPTGDKSGGKSAIDDPKIIPEVPDPDPLPGIGEQFTLSPTGLPYPKLSTLLPGRKGPVVEDGMILPWLSNRPALPTEEVNVVTAVDSDNDGEKDLVALRIVKPAEVAEGLKTPVIVRPSIYYSDPTYSTNSRGPFLGEDYYLRSGFTIVYADTIGSYKSTGCPTIMDQQERDGMKAVVQWLAGADGVRAFDKDGNEVVADWSTKHVAMEGVSYGGTLPLLAAATGVQGLEAIVPVAAVTNAYDYFNRYNGVRIRDTVSLEGYAENYTANPEKCVQSQSNLNDGVDNVSLNYNEFWAARNPLTEAKNIKAATLISHGQNDNNVKTHNSTKLYDVLQANKKPVQLWLHARAHTDPAWQKEWQKQILLWYTRYLFGVNNGVEKQPTYVRETPIGKKITGDLPSPAKDDRSDSLVGHCYHNSNSPRACSTTGELLVREAKWPETNDVSYKLQKTLEKDSAFTVANYQKVSYTLPEVKDATRVAGSITVDLNLTLDSDKIPDIQADLYVDGQRVTFGWGTLKFRDNIVTPQIVKAGESNQLRIRLMPRDFTLPPGATIRLDISSFSSSPSDTHQTLVTINEGKSALYFPTVRRSEDNADAIVLTN